MEIIDYIGDHEESQQSSKSPSTEVKGQQDFEPIKRHCETHCDWPNCTLDGCVLKLVQPSQPQEVGQDELWDEVGEILKHSWTMSGHKEKCKSKFTLIKK